jgi:hypothetical protein
MICTLSLGIGPGGVQSIQIALFEYYSMKGKPCKLFDIKTGWVYTELKRRNIDFIFIEIDKIRSKKDYSQYLDQNDLLILFNGNFFENILLFSHSKCKILFWEVYYPWLRRFIYTKYFPIKLLATQQEKKILYLLYSNNAIFFIDCMGKSFMENIFKTTISNNKYLPIPIKIPEKGHIAELKYLYIITYLGRAVDWKIYPLIKFMSDLIQNNIFNNEINIITDNSIYFHEKLEEYIPNIKLLKISYYENLSNESLDEVLRSTNLVIGMGMSALEGAKFGIPTILIDASYNCLPNDYKYRWLFDTEELSLGKIIDKNTVKYGGNMTAIDILKEIKAKYTKLSDLCYYYVQSNYDIQLVVNRIDEYNQKATLTMSSFVNLFIAKFFKVLRLLGIK